MQTPSFFLTKTFWLIFTIVVIISLYLYGLKMIGDKTEIAQTKKALASKIDELETCTTEGNAKAKQIEDLKKTISTQNSTITEQTNSISQKETTIQELQNTVTELQNTPPKVVTKYQDRTVYKDKPEPYHPYGKGYGKLSIYSECNKCSNIQVTVDGEYWGALQYYFNGQPNCGQEGAIAKTVLVGKHHIIGKDNNNRTWDYYTTVKEDVCNFWHYSY